MNDARREKLERQLAAAESEYRRKLIDALSRCAGGYWGLLGHNDHPDLREDLRTEMYEGSGGAELDRLGAEIAELRDRLGLFEPFTLHARLQAERVRKDPNRPGEPKLARAWLGELAAEPNSSL